MVIAFGGMGEGGLIAVIIILIVVFGSQLPKIARNVGLAGREFRKAQLEAEEEAEREREAKAAREAANQPAGQLPQAPEPPSSPEQSIELTRAELDALLKAREEQVRGEQTSG